MQTPDSAMTPERPDALICHICGKRRDEPGELYCSAAHPLESPAARVREFERPAEEDERRALRWLLDVREHGGPLERAYAASVIQTLAYFEQEAPVDTRP